MKCQSSALWNRLGILTRMCTVCGDVKRGLEPFYRYLGELETDRVGGGAEVGCVASGPRTSRAPRPGHHKRSWVRRQILCEDMHLLFYLLLICVLILLYCCSMHCMRDPSRFLRYPYEPSGLLLVWTTLSSIRRCTTGTSQVQDRGQSAWVVGARVILEMTDDIWSVFILYVRYIVLIQVCIDCCISRQMSCI